MKLKIIHTNDVHSNFENFSRAATLIKKYKDTNTLVLDGGDFADFKSIELRGTKGMAAIEMLESIGYDALTIGNNEMFNGIDTLEYMASHSPFPFISNNLVKKDETPIHGVITSTIIEKNGLRILITGSSPDLGVFNVGLGIQVSSFKDAVTKEIEKNKGNYDICIVLSHISTVRDAELARDVTGIDVIISAHDHQLYPEAKIVNRTIMNSAGNYGEHIGILELDVSKEKIELLHSATLSTRDSEMDEEILRILKVNKEKAVETLERPLYAIQQPLWHDPIEENPLTNLLADGLKDMLDTDIGLINSGIVNAGLFSYLSEKKLIEICPSPLNPTSFEIQGKHIRAAIQQSLDVQVCLADGKGPGFRGKFVGRLHVSGARLEYDRNKVTGIFIGDHPLEDDTWYTVATSDYLQRGSGYASLANNKNDQYLADDIRDVIKRYAGKPEFAKKAYQNRWVEKGYVHANPEKE